MMLDTIKNYVKKNVNSYHKFKHNAVRNQYDEFEGYIITMYSHIFLIMTSDNKVKSFSYSDILIKNLEIIM